MAQPYLSLEAQFHDAFWAAEDDSSEVRLMVDFLKEFSGRALEIGSGSGRLLLPLLQAGFQVEGLELSEDMVRLCASSAKSLQLDPLLHLGDMSEWTPSGLYGSLLVPAFTLQLANDPAATLQHWRTWLMAGGGLYLTLFTPYAELEGELEEGVWYLDHETTLPDGRKACLDTKHKIDPENQILTRQHRYYDAEQPAASHESTQTLRWYNKNQIVALLSTAGFEVKTAFVDFDPARKATQRQIDQSDGILTIVASAR